MKLNLTALKRRSTKMPMQSEFAADRPSRLTGSDILEIGGRLEHEPSDRLIQAAFKSELDDQMALSDFMDWVDLAHTLVMIESGIIPSEAGRELLKVILQLNANPSDFVPTPAKGDIYTNREAWLGERSPAVHWLGAGRARREATTTAYQLKVRKNLIELAEALTATGQALVARADEFSAALMPDYTYLQSAQPTTFGHYLLGFAYPLLRDLERLRQLYERVNLSPAGCGSTNGSRLMQHRERLSAMLGFEGVVVHARDAMWQADLQIEVTALLTAILINLDRLAEDLQIFATDEFGLIGFDDRHARASKIMPQKKNPFALTHIRGMTGKMIGALTTSAVVGRTPSGQPDNRLPLYGLIPQSIENTRLTVALMGEVLTFLSFNVQHARSKLDRGFTLAADLAEVLVLECGISFRQAHRLVGYIVRLSLPAGNFNALTLDDLALAGEAVLGQRIELSDAVLKNALNPEVSIAMRTETGGVAPTAMQEMLVKCSQALQESTAWYKSGQYRLKKAEKSLFQTAQAYAGLSNSLPESEKAQADADLPTRKY